MEDISDLSPVALILCQKFVRAYSKIKTIRNTLDPPNTLAHLTQCIDLDYALVYSDKRIYIRRVIDRKIVAYAKPNDIHSLSRLLGKYLETKENDILRRNNQCKEQSLNP